MNFKINEPVYIPERKVCGVIKNEIEHYCNCLDVWFQFGPSKFIDIKKLRHLDKEVGYYTPMAGDDRVGYYDHRRSDSDRWMTNVGYGGALREDNFRTSNYRFPLDKEAKDSEKWAREFNKNYELEKSKIKDILKSDKLKYQEEIEYYKDNEKLKNSTILDLMGEVEELKRQLKSPRINWRLKSEFPKVGDVIVIAYNPSTFESIISNSIFTNYIMYFIWTEDSVFRNIDLGWVPANEFNIPIRVRKNNCSVNKRERN